MSILKGLFSKKQSSCCDIKIEEVKSEEHGGETEVSEKCCETDKKNDNKPSCC